LVATDRTGVQRKATSSAAYVAASSGPKMDDEFVRGLRHG
jgi:hypothetical protein